MTIFDKEQKKIIALSSLGGALEFYDFIIFVFLAKIISQLFFPSHNEVVSLMETFTVFAVGYLARPLGGLFFGHWGDKFGRKNIFLATVLLMVISTTMMGCLPTYESIGIWASVLLVLLRLLQGFSVGGEIPGAVVFVSETVDARFRGLAAAIIIFGVNIGLLMGSLGVSYLLRHLDADQMHAWGWRLPFWIGGLLGIVSYYLRKQLHETPAFKKIEEEDLKVKFPIKHVLSNHIPALLQVMPIIAMQAVIVSLNYLFMPTYLSEFFNKSLPHLFILNSFAILVITLATPFAGFLSDKFGRKKIVSVGILFYLICSYPLFLLLGHQDWGVVTSSIIILSLFGSMVSGCFTIIAAEAFPTPIRYSGVALSYNLSFGIVGGLSPLVATYLIHHTGNLFSPSFCFISIALLALIALKFLPETHRVNILLDKSK